MKSDIRSHILSFLFAVTLLCVGCSPLTQEEDVMCDVTIRLQIPEGIKAEQMNLKLTCDNLNTLETILESSIDSNVIKKRVERGLYIIKVDGIILTKDDKSHKTKVIRVRGYMDKVLWLHDTEDLTVPLSILLL